jgi:hypothetical protein
MFRNLFKPKPKSDIEMTQKVFDYFKIEKTENKTLLLGDFANKDFQHWLTFIHGSIQAILKAKPFDGKTMVENYVNLTLHIGGQRVDVAIVKDGCKSPHELLQEAKKQLEETNASV